MSFVSNSPTYRVSLALARDAVERAETYLSDLHSPSPTAISLIEQADGSWRLDAYFDTPPDIPTLSAALGAHCGQDPHLTSEKLADVDWVALSQQGLHPVRAGRFLVHGSHDQKLAHASRWAIEIDAGQAFGTAHHGSTLGCLRAIDELSKHLKTRNILELGTGSGVLSIAAARVWNANVLAGDLDPIAVKVARENCRRNGAGANVRTVTAVGLHSPLIRARAPYDLVIANILARPLIGMAHEIAKALKPGGFVILSGITREQAGRVAAAYIAAGFARRRQITISEWVTLTLVRVSRRP